MSKKTLVLYLCILIILLAGVGFGLYAIVSSDAVAGWAGAAGPTSLVSPSTTAAATHLAWGQPGSSL